MSLRGQYKAVQVQWGSWGRGVGVLGGAATTREPHMLSHAGRIRCWAAARSAGEALWLRYAWAWHASPKSPGAHN